MIDKKTEQELLDVDICNADDYIGFLADTKFEDTADISYSDIARLASIKFGVDRSSTWYRRHLRDYYCVDQRVQEYEPELDNEYADMLLELKKERVKISDERTQNNAYIRRLAREDTIKEIAEKAVADMNDKFIMPYVPKVIEQTDKEGILCLSDWHYGFDFKNHFNTYNPEVSKARVQQLLEESIAIIKKENLQCVRVLNLGDLIAGRIHLTIRLESRFDVITQIMHVSEMLSEFLYELSKVCEVHYYSTIDNHSRLEPNKKDALDLESLARITDWYVKQRLGNSVTVHDNEFGPDIISFTCLGHKILGIHGDKDNHTTMIDKLSMMTRQSYDLVLAAHLHHYSSDEKNTCVSIGNGSLMGTDSYAQSLRLTSTPSQNFVVVTPRNVTESIHRIILK